MNLRHLGVTLALSAVGLAVLAPAAQSRPYEEYRDYHTYRYFAGRDRPETRRRQLLRDRLFDLADRARLAARERQISRGEAGHIYRRLDDVRDFLRHDHYLTEAEFDRRSDDLDRISHELRHERREERYRDLDRDRDRERERYDRDRDRDEDAR